MWANLLKHRYYSIYSTYLDQIEPAVRAALLSGNPIQIPKNNRLKSSDPNLTDEEGNMLPFCVVGHDFSADGGIVQGKSRSNTSSQKNIQVIPLRGVMEKDGGFCSYGTKDVKAWIDQANADPNIDAIVLLTDSPGGSVDGTEELSQAVRDSGKPIIAFVDGLAASAAVWVTSQAKEIVINQETTAFYGSIGVISTIINSSKALAKDGYEVTIIRDSTSPDKAKVNSIEPIDEETMAVVMADLNSIKSTFVSYVKAGRGDRLQGDGHFSGKVWNGKEAVKNGLADRIGTLQSAVDLAAKYASKPQDSNPNNSNKKKMKVNANVTPLLASAMAFAAEQTEAEIEEINLVALESHLSSQAAALSEAQTAITAAIEAKATAEATVKASEAELNTLREWKKSAGNIHIRQEDEGNDDTTPVDIPAYNQEAMDAYDQIHGKKKKK